MHLITGDTINDTILRAYKTIQTEGQHADSRNNGATALYRATFEILNPRSRHLALIGRKSNIFQMIAETLWVMSGSNVLNPYLTFFLPRAPNYSDDGITWHGAYGPRMYDKNQLEGVVDCFKKDGKMTRRAQVAIYDAGKDSPGAFADAYGFDHKPKDIPCNSFIYFFVKPDNTFNCHVTQRSGDLIFGTGSINPFEFSFLQELMFNEVKKIYPEVTLGSYSWYVNNAHVYDEFASQATVAASTIQVETQQNHMTLVGPEVSKWEPFFAELVGYLSFVIDQQGEETVGDAYAAVAKIFDSYDVLKDGNLLYEYVHLTLAYILSKFGKEQVRYRLPQEAGEEFSYAIINSSFRKFEVN